MKAISKTIILTLLIVLLISQILAHSHSNENQSNQQTIQNQHRHNHDHNHDHNHNHNHDHNHNHNHDHKHEDQNLEQSDHHSHSHSHSHEDEHMSIEYLIEKNQFAKQLFAQVQEFYSKNLESQIAKVTFSIILVSLPSIPTFLILIMIQKFSRNSSVGFSQNLLNTLISFSVGTLLGDVLLHMLPHLIVEDLQSQQEGSLTDFNHNHSHSHSHDLNNQESGHDHQHINPLIPMQIIFGICIFMVLDFLMAKMHGHDHSHSHDHDHDHSHDQQQNKSDNKKGQNEKQTNKKSDQQQQKKQQSFQNSKNQLQAITYLIGDLLHNFTDGLAIAAAFSHSIQMGLTTTLVVIVHELPHELGDFAYLIKKSYSLGSVLCTQLITSIGALIGGIVGIYFGELYRVQLLCLTAGGFLYMSLSQVLPEVREHNQGTKSFFDLIKTIVMIQLGVLSMYYITLIE